MRRTSPFSLPPVHSTEGHAAPRALYAWDGKLINRDATVRWSRGKSIHYLQKRPFFKGSFKLTRVNGLCCLHLKQNCPSTRIIQRQRKGFFPRIIVTLFNLKLDNSSSNSSLPKWWVFYIISKHEMFFSFSVVAVYSLMIQNSIVSWTFWTTRIWTYWKL